jgi:hypothetical protein
LANKLSSSPKWGESPNLPQHPRPGERYDLPFARIHHGTSKTFVTDEIANGFPNCESAGTRSGGEIEASVN